MQGERGRRREGPKKQMKNGRDLLRQQQSHGNGARFIISAGGWLKIRIQLKVGIPAYKPTRVI